MQRRLMVMTGAGLAGISLLLSGCGGFKLWPLGGNTIEERSRTPANATEYQCAGGKRFYLRTLEGGAAVWLILPERELRLDRIGPEPAMRYGKGNTVLELGANEATIKDGAAVSFAACKTTVGDPK